MDSDDSFAPNGAISSDDFMENEEDEFVPDAVEKAEEVYVPDGPVIDDDFEPAPTSAKKKRSSASKKRSSSVKKKKAAKGINEGQVSNKRTAPKPIAKAAPKKRAKKTKTKKASAPKLSIKESEAKICAYVKAQNRPLNSVAVYENLKRAVPKSKLSGILEDLASRPEVTGVRMKKFGKQSVFFANQDFFEDATPERMAALKKEKAEADVSAQERHQVVANLRAEKHQLEAAPTDAELAESTPKLNAVVEGLLAELQVYQSAGLVLDPEMKSKALIRVKKLKKVWKDRKRAVMDVVDQWAEGAEKKPKKIMEIAGLETDEDCGADLSLI